MNFHRFGSVARGRAGLRGRPDAVNVREIAAATVGLLVTALTYLAWLFAITPIIGMSAAQAAAWLLALLALFLLVHVALNLRATRVAQCELLRLDPPRPHALGRLVIAAPFVVVFTLAFGALLVYVGQTPSDAGAGIPDYTGPLAWLPVALLLIVFAPLLEEFVFRGWLQHRLERLVGVAPAIAVTALLFAAAHGWNAGNVNRFVLGLAFGTAVWASRSIWSGVLLHAVNNASAVAVGGFMPESWSAPADMIPWISRHGGAAPLAALSALGAIGLGLAVTAMREVRRVREGATA